MNHNIVRIESLHCIMFILNKIQSLIVIVIVIVILHRISHLKMSKTNDRYHATQILVKIYK